MLRKDLQREISNATVGILKKGGQGVLVGGGLVLTAAHCIEFDCTGKIALGDYFIEDIKTRTGIIKAVPLAVEPVSDIAILGSLDAQVSPKEAEEFENFCEKTNHVPLFLDNFPASKDFSVYIYSHEGKWIAGKGKQFGETEKTLWIETEEPIEGGTSGGPIVNESGALVGIVSSFSIPSAAEKSNGWTPRPHLCLPVWACSRILDGKIILPSQRP